MHDYVAAHPGSHLREIARALSLPLGTALYHLDYLSSRGLLVARRDGRYKRFFIANSLGRREKDLVTAFRHAAPRRIAEALLAGRARTQRELCAAVGVSRSTLSFHLKGLIEQQIVLCDERWPENHYRLIEPEESSRVLEQFRASFETIVPTRAPEPTAPPAVAAS